MNLRSLTITVAVLGVLCAVAWFLQRPAAPVSADVRVGQAMLPSAVATQAAQIRIVDAGKTVTLARQADGSWTVPSYYDFPADFAKVSRFVGDLTEAKIQRLVTARADRLGRLEFKDTTLALLDTGGKELWQVTLGKYAEGGGRFVRYGTEDKGYLATLSLSLDPEARSWAETTLLNLKAGDLAQVEVGFANTPAVTASRAKPEDPWTAADAPADKRLKADRLTALLSGLTELRFTDTTATDDEKAVAARAHSRTLKLTTFDQKTYTVTLGRQPEEKKPKPPAAPPKDAAAANIAPKPADAADKAGEEKKNESKPAEPEFETIPAGPVFAAITCSDEKAPINTLMRKRAFEIYESAFTSLPSTRDELWEDKPATAPPAKPDNPPKTTESDKGTAPAKS